MTAVASPPNEALELSESVSLTVIEEARALYDSDGVKRFEPEPGSVFDAQGRVPVFVIRPGIGKGRGRHLYEASMLQENAENFANWKQYVDHRSPAAKKAAEGLPRSLRDIGGRIVESWWDPNVPADALAEHDQGAVIGLSKPVPWVRELIESDPELVEASISATATGVRPVTRGGQKVWLVEGINKRGSVDWVTEAGAGGRVAPLLEAAYENAEEAERVLLEAMDDDEVREYLRESRPHLIDESGVTPTPASAPEGGDVTEIKTEDLQEALSSPDTLTAILSSPVVEGYINTLVEARVGEIGESLRAEASADARRDLLIRDLRDEAQRTISESKLPDRWKVDLAKRYELEEGRVPTALDLVDDVDGDGNVTKSAVVKLRESLEADITSERERLAAVAPTRVHAPVMRPGENGEQPKFEAGKTGWGRLLRESAHLDPEKTYHLQETAG